MSSIDDLRVVIGIIVLFGFGIALIYGYTIYPFVPLLAIGIVVVGITGLFAWKAFS
ncbi:MAG: hypothetical protein HY223_05350 [Thaumarchaeota archaeon]|nr:hypothetical protein [Nitrososphaerota archaeon]